MTMRAKSSGVMTLQTPFVHELATASMANGLITRRGDAAHQLSLPHSHDVLQAAHLSDDEEWQQHCT